MNLLGIQIRTERRSDSMVNNESVWTGSRYWTSDGTDISGTADSAIRSGAVYSCVRLIAETIGSLPLVLYRRLPDGGKEKATDRSLYWTLNNFPNRRNTRMELVETFCWHLLLRGNAYLLITVERNGKVSIDLLHPDRTRPKFRSDGTLYYSYFNGSKERIYEEFEVCHIRMQSEDGIIGRSPIQVARETVYRSVMGESFQTQTYKNGFKPAGVLRHPKTLTKEAADRISASFAKAYGGVANAGKLPLLEEGLELVPFTMSLEDAQFLEGRKMTRSEIAGIFGVPPHMIADLEHATFSNIENQAIQFVVHTIRPYLVRIEQSLHRTILGEDEHELYTIEFLADALLRGDTASRFLAHTLGIQNGMTKFNEARERENWNPLPWGDATMVPLNSKIIRSEKDLEPPPDTGNSGNDPQNKGAFTSAIVTQFRADIRRMLDVTITSYGRGAQKHSIGQILLSRTSVIVQEFVTRYCAARASEGCGVKEIPNVTNSVLNWCERFFSNPDVREDLDQVSLELVEAIQKEIDSKAFS